MNWLRRFMYGRYGGDQLSWFLLAVYVLLVVLSGLPHLELLSWLALAVLFWSFYPVSYTHLDVYKRQAPRSS